MPGSAQLASGMLALALAGCQHVPPAPIDPGANAARLEQRTLAAPAVEQALEANGEQPGEQGWTLDELTLAAWALRQDVAISRTELEAARAGTRVARERLNPVASGSSERVTNASGTTSPWVLATALAFTFESGGKRDIRTQRALANERVSAWTLGETLWTARAEVRDALYGREFALEAVSLDEEEAALRRDYRDWVEARFASGAATVQERLSGSEALAAIESQLARDRAALASARAALATAVGLVPGALAQTRIATLDVDTPPALSEADSSQMRALAVTNRVDVQRALAEYEVSEQDLRAAVAEQYPNLTLGPGYMVDQGDRKITLALDLPVPLFHNADALIARAVADRAVAASRFDQVQAQALAQIGASLASYRATLTALEAARDAEAQAEQGVASVQRVYDAGAANRGELAAGKIALAVRRRNTLDARRAVAAALAALENAVERPIYPASSISSIGEEYQPEAN